MVNTTVTLSSNGKYWQAFYYDVTGKRRAKGLGAKSKLSKRKAKVLCDRLAADLQVNPGIISGGPAPKLFAFLDRYLASRTEIRKSTRSLYQQTIYYLKDFFDDIRVDHITRLMAGDFRTYLARQKCRDESISEQTVRKHIRNCKTIFASAVAEDILLLNPFSRQKSAPLQPDKDWYYLSIKDFEKILDACANKGWQAFLGLCRLAGLRRSEAWSLTWERIDWAEHRITVLATKTKKKRIVPIEPRLYEILLATYDNAEEGTDRVCQAVGRNNLRRTFHALCRRVGLEPWGKWCHTLRKNAETDLAQLFPQYVVSYWIGHSIEVSEKHYLQVPEELYEKAACCTSKQEPPRRPSPKSKAKSTS